MKNNSIDTPEFDSIEIDVNDYSNHENDDLVLHGSITKPLKKPANKYVTDKYYSNGSVISPSVEEERYHKQYGNESNKQTIRERFRDDPDEEVYGIQNKNLSIVAPSVTNMDEIEIMKLPKQKPQMKDKPTKSIKGEKLTTETAVEFMIKERQMMDREFATLRAENEELRERVERQQHHGRPETIVIEKVVEKKVNDPNSEKWKHDVEYLRKENEKLKKLYSDTQAQITTQKQLAEEARVHRLADSINVEKKSTQSNDSSHIPEEKYDPDDDSTDVDSPVQMRRGQSEGRLPPKPIKSADVPKLDLSRAQTVSSGRPSSAPSKNHFFTKNDKHAPDLTGIPLLLWKGSILWKIPYNGNGRPERRHVVIKKATKSGKHSRSVKIITNAENSLYQTGMIFYPPTIMWANPDKPDDLQNARELTLYEGAHVVEGYQSPAFWKGKTKGTLIWSSYPSSDFLGLQLPPEPLCFSIVTSARSLDLAAENLKDAIAWKTAIHTLLIIMSSNPDWAADKLSRKEPIWYHQQLEDPPEDYHRKIKTPTPPLITHEPKISKKDHEQYSKATSEGIKQQLESMKFELFESTKNGDYERIQNILKKKKISVNVMNDPQQDTPLMIACRLGMVDIVNLLLYYGAKNDPHPNCGQTALHCAVESRSLLCVQALLNAALPSQSDSIIANLKDSKNQQTPLHFTCSFGDVKIAKVLISHGADISSKDKLSRTSLHICSYYGHKICLSYLLDNGGDSYLEVADMYGNTALHYCAEQGHVACVKLLLETAANPIVKNNKGYVPYDLAQMKGHLPVCKILMAYNVNPSLTIQTSISEPYISLSNPLERGTSYPSTYDTHLPRPHSNRPTSAGQLGLSPSYPVSVYTPMNTLYSPQLNQLYLDTAMSRSNSQGYVNTGSLTSRDRSPYLFQGLQLNNPLSARRMIDDDLHTSFAVGLHQPMSQTSAGEYYQSFSPVTTGHSSLHINPTSEQFPVPSPESTAPEYQPLEKFYYDNAPWEVYKTEEGHIYYLDISSQHSQWDDPRINGVIYYDDTPGDSVNEAAISDQDANLVVEEFVEESAGATFHKPRKASPEKPRKAVSKQPQKIAKTFSDSDEDSPSFRSTNLDEDVSDVMYGRMYARSGKFSRRQTRHESDTEQSAQDDIQMLPVIRKGNPNAFSDGSTRFLEPDHTSTTIDDNDSLMRTNCFSPDKASLQRAAALQRNLSNVTTSTSPKLAEEKHSTKVMRSTNESAKSITTKEYSPVNASTMYSDEDEGSQSDWDAETGNNNDSPSFPTQTGPLGYVEQNIKAQSQSTAGRKGADVSNHNSTVTSGIQHKKTVKERTVDRSVSNLGKPVKEEELKKNKIFSTEDGSYGNGGNIPAMEDTLPLASPFLHKLKDGGLSPRPPLDTQANSQQMMCQIEPYLQMLREGTSLVSVKNAMSKAGESRDLVKFLIETADEQHIIPSSTPSTINQNEKIQGPKKMSPEELALLKQDEIIGKYVKMHAMGVPVGNIEQKMKLDNIDTAEISRFMVAIGQELDEHEDNSPNEASRNSKGRKASVPLLKIHWSPLPAEKLSNSIFATARDDDSMHEEEFEEFEKLFGAQSKIPESRDAPRKSEENPKMKLYVLEPKRAQNIVIGLTQFKSIASHSTLLRSICSLNDINGQLTSDRLQNISQLLPSLPELKKLPDAKDSQHPAEVFCNLAWKYYPDLPKRLTCFITCTTFQESCITLVQKMKKVLDACNEVIASDNLARVLQKMLTVGNIMNEGTYRGQAAGFSLDSLIKMIHTKGVDKKTSILDYVVKSLIDRGEQSTLRVADDLTFDDETCRISGKDTSREIDHLQQSLNFVEEVYENALNNPSQSEFVRECTTTFCDRLNTFLQHSRDKFTEINKMKELMNRKIITVIEYFGEDERTCDTSKIFSVLKEFKTAFESSRVTLLGRMERSKSRQLRLNQS